MPEPTTVAPAVETAHEKLLDLLPELERQLREAQILAFRVVNLHNIRDVRDHLKDAHRSVEAAVDELADDA